MDLRVVESFVHVARHGSFSVAARSLGISPAAVSRNVRSLEQRLQVQLFSRTTRHVELTPEGARLLERCALAVEALAECTALPLAEQRPRTSLRVVATAAFGRTHLLPLLPLFMAAHPQLRLYLLLREEIDASLTESFDVAISPDPLPCSGHVGRQLLPVTLLVCASPAYLMLHGVPGCIADLGAHRLIGIRSHADERIAAWEFRQEDGTAVQIGIEPSLIVGDADTACAAALLGLGLAQLGSDLVLPHVAALRLKTALVDCACEPRGLYISWTSGRRTQGIAIAFVQHVVSHLSTRAGLIAVQAFSVGF